MNEVPLSVLAFSPYLPYPPDHGGRIRTFLLLRELVSVGRELVENALDTSEDVNPREQIEAAENSGRRLLLPGDHRIAQEIAEGAASRVEKEIPDGWMGVDIGPESAALYAREAREATTVFWNGPMGVFEIEAFAKGTETVAQAVAESNLREDARSPVGAVGVMQVMPRTFDEIQRKNPAIAGSVDQPRWNIAAGIWYDRQHFVVWAADRSLVERLKFTFGSYNAGRSSILRAQQFALGEGLNARLWDSVAGELPRVTGRRSQETVTYVARVLDIRQVLR